MIARKSKILKEDDGMQIQKRRKLYSVIASYFMIGSLVTVYSASTAANSVKVHVGKFTHDYAVASNVTRVSLILAFLSILVIDKLQGGAYSGIISRKQRERLDERQTNVRRKVLEKSYRAIGIILFIALYFAFQGSGRVMSIDMGDSNNLFTLVAAVLAVGALPNLVATWEKDS